MNDFLAKKSGEVLAFTQVGQAIISRADGLDALLGESVIAAILGQLKTFEEELLEAFSHDHIEAAVGRSKETSKKLNTLADTYIGDQWDNPVEVLEWLGFFEGAAIVHCAVVAGAAESLALADLLTLSTRMREFHHETLHAMEAALRQAGSDKATG